MRWVLALVVLAACAVGLGLVFREELLIVALDPGVAFDASAAPSAPEFASPEAWSARPESRDSADVAPAALPPIDPALAQAAVFYVHPTSYVGSLWNGPVDDPTLNANTDRLATRIQATAFNGCCAVYAPRYRQANGQAFIAPSADGQRARDLAYSDVLAAFRFFLAAEATGRPFFLASHSQGSVYAARLLRDEIASTPLRARLVSAYLIGGPIREGDLGGVPVCASPEQTRCAVAWNARGPRHRETVFDFRVDGERLCVNPLTWRHDEEPAEASLNQGAVFLHAGDGTVLPHFADARCHGGFLLVSQIGDAPRDFMSRILDWLMGPDNHHPIEYQLFWVNLRRNAEARLAAYLAP